MIVCHCARITDHDVHAAIDWMRASDRLAVVTPGKIYHALGKSPDCGGCMPVFLETMRRNDKLEVPPVLRGLKTSRRKGTSHER